MFEFAGEIAIYKVGPCFNHISQSIQSWRLKLSGCISYMIELSDTRKEKVWTYAGQPRRDIKFDFYFKLSFLFTCMGYTPRGDSQR